MLLVAGTLTVGADAHAPFLAAAAAVTTPTLAEDGCLQYGFWADPGDGQGQGGEMLDPMVQEGQAMDEDAAADQEHGDGAGNGQRLHQPGRGAEQDAAEGA